MSKQLLCVLQFENVDHMKLYWG